MILEEATITNKPMNPYSWAEKSEKKKKGIVMILPL